jgi:hypothetical protein
MSSKSLMQIDVNTAISVHKVRLFIQAPNNENYKLDT